MLNAHNFHLFLTVKQTYTYGERSSLQNRKKGYFGPTLFLTETLSLCNYYGTDFFIAFYD